MHLFRIIPFLACCLGWFAAGPALGQWKLADASDVSPVWSGHRVGFDLLTHGQQQYIAFYDQHRQMTVGVRTLPSGPWELEKLPTSVGWDSHNYIALAVDDLGCLHVCGNMHAVPLIYFRMDKPNDIHSLHQCKLMVGRDEEHCTYPLFLRGAADQLIFTYRSGSSGDGDQIYNVYNASTHVWRRLLDKPLTDGEGKRNAYFVGPVRGPDGIFHLGWVWRESPDCSTNHDLSYAVSKDLVHWTTSAGKPLKLPITLESGEIVDPIPIHGGVLNSGVRLGFDSHNRVVLTYYKFDAKGMTQIYNARLEEGGWKIYQMTDWEYRWDPRGGGSLERADVGVHEIEPLGPGRLAQPWMNVKYGSGDWLLDEPTMKVIGSAPQAAPMYPRELQKPESTFPGIGVVWRADSGEMPKGVRYVMRWEALPPNRDKPRTGPLPAPSMLRVYRFELKDDSPAPPPGPVESE